MKVFILFILLGIALANSNLEKWKEFKVKFNKTYATNEEESQRFAIFQKNLEIIDTHNRKFADGQIKHKLGITRFADQTLEEVYKKFHNEFPRPEKSNLEIAKNYKLGTNYCWNQYKKPELIKSLPNDDKPESIDYREKNIVMPPRDMGDRNEDYAFTVASYLESIQAIYNGTLEYLSPQYVIDCWRNLYEAYYFTFYNGLPREVDYPLIEGKGECKELCTGFCYGFSVLAHESIIETVVGLLGPVSIYFDGADLPLYESGIIDGTTCYSYPDDQLPDPSEFKMGFSAVIIGYGSENGTDYWIVKNSWGTSWGEDGYFRLIRGKLACGIETFPVSADGEEPQGKCDH